MKLPKTVCFKWIKSILLVIALILLFCSILCGYMIFLLRRNTLQMSSDLTRYIQYSIDSRLMDVYKYSATLELHPTNQYLKKLKAAPPTLPSEVYRFSDLMLNYKYSNKLIQRAFIYYPYLNLVVGDLGCYQADSYYALDNTLVRNGYDRWLAGITSEAGSDFVYLESDSRNQFCYIKKMLGNGERVGYMVFELNSGELLNSALRKGEEAPTASSIGILLDGKLAAHSGTKDTLIWMSQYIPHTLHAPVTLEKSGFLLYARPSKSSSLLYLNVYLQKQTLQPVYIAFGICILGILACGIVGIAASFHIGRKNAKPLHNLLDKVGASHGSCTDEYQTINECIDQLLQDTHDHAERVQNQQSLISSYFLRLVLCGTMHNEYAIFHAAKRCDIIFENPRYLAALAEPVGLQSTLDDHYLLKLNAYCEGHGFDVISTFYEGKLVMCFNLEETAGQSAVAKFMKQLKRELFLEDQWRIALGMDYDGLVNIQCSYTQAVTALQYGPAGEPSVICYNHCMEQIPGSAGSYIDVFESFTADMIQNDYEAALVLVPSVFEQYFEEKDSFEITRVKTMAIQNLLLNARQKAKKGGKKPNGSIHTAQILSCPSAQRLREYTECILKELSAQTFAPKGSSSTVAERAKDIIHRDFTNPMLGLYLISAELKVSDSYLSTTFKNAFGTGVVQYINYLRIEQAKKLICNTDLSIREIAKTVGFSSDASFIRVFKRYEMQTPNALRKRRG